ncbi:Short-chain dehydrogenase ptmH [Penicillium chermesinum]|uniref:Short-chain dehydrogenase ptmH n=1 Tax=Penicillium chermesinum TaxID=63820 RepID=A0A9W9TJL2_9EURO|nr:Short-chain dehydrogenase ptmH [Penicillium chermesinum]KAJ5225171.1 Short-chain dehydrogenase ptmH [Penicillium chermesinum]KAJ6140485.1 Short-chain dehydrogenase ptmH [Penicillium chermesinum]
MPGVTDTRKSVLITGCSPGGIGNALAREFHRNGLRVLASARTADAISDLAELGIETLTLVVDDPESIKACHAEIESRLGDKGLDYLVNNAGRNLTVPALEVDLTEARQTFETNFFAVIAICQTFAPLLIKAKGTIVQIGSVTAVLPYVFGSVYNASKAALHAFSDSLRIELAPYGVKVTTIVTGGIKSRIARTERTLKADSLYADIEDSYQRRVVHSQAGSWTSEEYARKVVPEILWGSAPWRWLWPWAQGNKHYIWAGRGAWLIYILSGGFTWFGLMGWYMSKAFKLNQIRRS